MARLIDADVLKKTIERNLDMQDLYLPSNFLVIVDDAPTLVCHTNLKANAELICKIMDADVDNKLYDEAHDGCENCKYMNSSEYDEPCCKCKHNYKDMFKPMPHPHWVTLKDCANEGIYCSECNTKIFDYTHTPPKKLSNYCPHCGADMRGDKDAQS